MQDRWQSLWQNCHPFLESPFCYVDKLCLILPTASNTKTWKVTWITNFGVWCTSSDVLIWHWRQGDSMKAMQIMNSHAGLLPWRSREGWLNICACFNSKGQKRTRIFLLSDLRNLESSIPNMSKKHCICLHIASMKTAADKSYPTMLSIRTALWVWLHPNPGQERGSQFWRPS